MECKDELKQQMSALQGELDGSKSAKWVSYSHCGLGSGLMECKEELKQQVSALQGSLMVERGLIGGYHRVIVVWRGG